MHMANWPVIGLSGSHNVPDRQLFVRENYMQSVLRAGGVPVLLPQTDDPAHIAAILDSLDGVLLAGGGDVAPERYGQTPIPACGEADPQRDAFELALISMAVARNMPVFGICRGIQILTVALGGTLIQDIETQCGIPTPVHQQQPPYSAATHEVRFVPGSIFEHITGTSVMQVNSMHHQAIKCVGARLRVEGRSTDGIIEAVSDTVSDRIFAVQFHPEYMADHDAHAARLFDHLVALAGAYRCEKRA